MTRALARLTRRFSRRALPRRTGLTYRDPTPSSANGNQHLRSVTPADHRKVLFPILAILVVRLIAAATLIPAWQGPDEPQHLFLVSVLANGYEEMASLESQVVASMYRNGWWEYYQRPRPPTTPKTFRDGPALVTDVHGAPGGPRAYHDAAAFLLRTANVRDVEGHYRLLRVVSAACGVLTLVLAWYANRAAFGPLIGAASVVMLAFHPQFLLVSITVNPDAVIVLIGAVAWAAAVYGLTRKPGWALVIVMGWAAAFLGLLTRRVAFPLLVDLAIVSVVLTAASRRRFVAAAVLVVGFALAGLIFVVALGERGSVALASSVGTIDVVGALRSGIADPPFVARLTRTLFESSWLTAGWMRFSAPGWWYFLVLMVCATGVVGLARELARARELRHVLSLALVFVLVQIIGVFVAYLPLRAGVQGRYLMPVALPLFALLVTGLRGVLRSMHPDHFLRVVVAVCALLDALAWVTVLIPVYLPPL
jgi:hypothetical protein